MVPATEQEGRKVYSQVRRGSVVVRWMPEQALKLGVIGVEEGLTVVAL